MDNELNDGYFGIGIEHNKFPQNIGTLFRSAINLGANFIFTVGKRYDGQSSDTVNSFNKIPLYNFDNIEDLKKHLPYGCPLIGIEIDENAIQLDKFLHPDKACYLLGAEDHGLTNEAYDNCHALVSIPSRGCLNVSVTGSIVMYDRKTKNKRGYQQIEKQ